MFSGSCLLWVFFLWEVGTYTVLLQQRTPVAPPELVASTAYKMGVSSRFVEPWSDMGATYKWPYFYCGDNPTYGGHNPTYGGISYNPIYNDRRVPLL